MSRKNLFMEHLLNDRPDLKAVKEYYFEHYPLIQIMGAVNYMCLYGGTLHPESAEEVFAFYLLGATRLFYFRDTIPGSVEEAWGLVQFLLEDLLPETVEVKFPVVTVELRERRQPV